MKFLKQVLNFYINASIHVAFAVYAFLRITEFYCNILNQERYNYFLFFGTITGYNFVKYAGVAKLHYTSLTSNLKSIQIFSFLCFLAMCYYAYFIQIQTLLYCLPLAVLTVLYAVPFLSGFHKSLRQISYLKIVIVAFVWAGFTVAIPLLTIEKQVSVNALLFFFQRFLLVIVLILPFDIRDLTYDAISLQTIPQKIGIQKTKKLGIILVIISLVLEYLLSDDNQTKTPFMLFVFALIFFLMRAKKQQTKYFSSFWVELLPIAWWVFILAFS